MLFWWDLNRPVVKTRETTTRQKVLNDLDNRMSEFLAAKGKTGCPTVIDRISSDQRSIRNERKQAAFS